MSTIRSLRIDADLDANLRKAAENMHRKPNWIINEALREYLAKSQKNDLATEAKQQLALIRNENDDWETYVDTDF